MKPSILLSFLCIIVFVNQSIAQTCTSTLEEEYEALMALYQSTNGAGWTNNTGWSAADPNLVQSVQGWYGLTTDAQGHVISLDMPINNLQGPLPTQIGDLKCLQNLSFFGNPIGGTIPSSIGGLLALKNLTLMQNDLTGSIPASLGNLTNLTSLNLHGNHLTGTIPNELGNLSLLKVLQLSHNQLSGTIPASIGNLVTLEHLILYDGELTGPLPSSLGNLTNLIYFGLGNNLITGSIPSELGNLSQLKTLGLNINLLSGSVPASLGNLTNLEILDLNTNQLSGSIPADLGGLTNLKSLILYKNQLSGPIPSDFGDLNNLETLSLAHNELAGSIPSTLGGLQKLISLDLFQNNISGSIPAELGDMTLLQTLTLADNQLSGTIPGALGSLSSLRQLELHTNQLTGSIPNEIGNLVNLRYLILCNNQLSGALPSFGSLTNLIQLNVHTNQLTGTLVVNSSGLNTILIHTNKFSFAGFLSVKQNYPQAAFEYNLQNLIDIEKTLAVAVGQSLNLTTSIDRNTTPASVYQWFKVVNEVITALNAPSTSGHTFEIQNIAETDDGTIYYYTITNSAAPLLTLKSRNQTLEIITCNTPTIDFTTEELNGTHTFNPTFTGEGCTPTYTWDFGDGATSTEQAASHSYASTGTFNVTLTIAHTCGPCPSGQLVIAHEVVIENSFCGSIYCDGAGGVGIGTQVTEGFRLSVNGKIRASDIIKVYPHGQWSDFVFEKDYKLRPLSEVESFIKANGHLPEIPSAKEVEKEGIDLGGMDAKLLQKIEELTLYIIAQQRKFEEQEKKFAEQQKQIEELKRKFKQ